MLQPKMFRP